MSGGILYFERCVAALLSNDRASSSEVVALLAEITNTKLMKARELKELQSGGLSSRRDSDLDVAQQKIAALEWDICRLEALVPKLQEALDRATERERAQLDEAQLAQRIMARTLEQQSHRKQQSN